MALGTYPPSLFEKEGRRGFGGYPPGAGEEVAPIEEKPVLGTYAV